MAGETLEEKHSGPACANKMTKASKYFCMVLILMVISAVTFIHVMMDFSLKFQIIFDRQFPDDTARHQRKIGTKIVACILQQKKATTHEYFEQIINGCVREHSNISFPDNFISFKMGRFNESKRFLMPNSSEKNSPNLSSKCTWLTIGIGGDSQVEKELNQKYPECKIYGVEAAPKDVADFGKYGEVIPLAVGVKPGILPMKVRVKEGGYANLHVLIHPLHQVLDKYLKKRLVSFGTMDIEGFEYTILNGFKQPNGVFAKKNVTFCQLDVELHDPTWQKGFDFGTFFHKLLRSTTFVPVHGEGFLGIHRKVTFIDGSGNDECETLFRFSRFF